MGIPGLWEVSHSQFFHSKSQSLTIFGIDRFSIRRASRARSPISPSSKDLRGINLTSAGDFFEMLLFRRETDTSSSAIALGSTLASGIITRLLAHSAVTIPLFVVFFFGSVICRRSQSCQFSCLMGGSGQRLKEGAQWERRGRMVSPRDLRS